MKVVLSIHDVAPTTIERVDGLRELIARSIGAVPLSLLVVPRYHGDSHWDQSARTWLRARAMAGDEIVAHGLSHMTPSGRDGAEFVGVGLFDPATALSAARRDLERLGVDAKGFIAPAYGHTNDLERALRESGLNWWATRMGLRWSGGGRTLPSLGLGTSTWPKRQFSPAVAYLAAQGTARVRALRLDLHPPDGATIRGTGSVARLLDLLLESHGRVPTTHAALAGQWRDDPGCRRDDHDLGLRHEPRPRQMI